MTRQLHVAAIVTCRRQNPVSHPGGSQSPARKQQIQPSAVRTFGSIIGPAAVRSTGDASPSTRWYCRWSWIRRWRANGTIRRWGVSTADVAVARQLRTTGTDAPTHHRTGRWTRRHLHVELNTRTWRACRRAFRVTQRLRILAVALNLAGGAETSRSSQGMPCASRRSPWADPRGRDEQRTLRSIGLARGMANWKWAPRR